MSNFSIFKSSSEKNSSSGYKSTVLAPLAWFLGISFSGLIASVASGAPKWLLVLVAIFVSIAFVLYMFSYLYCLFNDRDSLRSEWFTINKIAMEKGVFGDSSTGNMKIELPEVKKIENKSMSEDE